MVRRLLERLDRERRGAPEVILPLKTFEVWCTEAGFKSDGEALDALRDADALRSYRMQSGRIKLFFEPK